MGSGRVMVMKENTGQDAAQVMLVKDDDVIQTFAADRADEALDIGVLPGRPRRGNNLFDAHPPKAIAKGRTIGCVPVPQQIAGRGVPGKGLGDLAR